MSSIFCRVQRKTLVDGMPQCGRERQAVTACNKTTEADLDARTMTRRRRWDRRALYVKAKTRHRSTSSGQSPPPKNYGHHESESAVNDETNQSWRGRAQLKSAPTNSTPSVCTLVYESASALGYPSISLVQAITSTTLSPRRRRSSVRFKSNPTLMMWMALRRSDLEKVYDILLNEWKRVATNSSANMTCACQELEQVEVKELNVNEVNDKGISALHLCAFAGNPRCVRLLLALGADPNKGDLDNWTPLHAAAVKDQRDIILMLAGAGACARTRDRKRRRPCDVTASKETKQLLRRLHTIQKKGGILTDRASDEAVMANS